MAVIATEQRELLDAEHGAPAHQQAAQSPQQPQPQPQAAPVRGTNPRGGKGAPPGGQPTQRPRQPRQAQPQGSGRVRKGDLQSLISIFAPMA